MALSCSHRLKASPRNSKNIKERMLLDFPNHTILFPQIIKIQISEALLDPCNCSAFG